MVVWWAFYQAVSLQRQHREMEMSVPAAASSPHLSLNSNSLPPAGCRIAFQQVDAYSFHYPATRWVGGWATTRETTVARFISM